MDQSPTVQEDLDPLGSTNIETCAARQPGVKMSLTQLTLQYIGQTVHLFFFLLYYYTLYIDVQIDFPANKLYAGRWKFLTFLNLVAHVLYFTLALSVDILDHVYSGKWVQTLTKIRDYFFAVVAFPVGVFVCISFWGIYFKNRDLIFPKFLDEIMPPLLNHALHTMCAVSMIVEAIAVKHEYPSKRNGLMGLWTVTLIYIIWVHWVAYYGGFWVYPILRSLGPYTRSMFLGLSAIVSGLMYLYGAWLTELVWTPDAPAKSKPVKGKEPQSHQPDPTKASTSSYSPVIRRPTVSETTSTDNAYVEPPQTKTKATSRKGRKTK